MAAPVSKWWECRYHGCERERVGYTLWCPVHIEAAARPWDNAPGTWTNGRPNGASSEYPYPYADEFPASYSGLGLAQTRAERERAAAKAPPAAPQPVESGIYDPVLRVLAVRPAGGLDIADAIGLAPQYVINLISRAVGLGLVTTDVTTDGFVWLLTPAGSARVAGL